MKSVLQWAISIGADPRDEDDIRLQKALLVACSLPFVITATAWGATYYAFGEPLAGSIPLTYAVISLLSIIYFGLTRQYHFFRFSQLTLILLLPFFLMWALGGFVNGSAVILWSLVCPMGALLFDEPKRAPRWFLAFLTLVIAGGVLQPFMPADNNLPPGAVTFFFVINLAGVAGFIFPLVYYFVLQKNDFQARSESLLLNILPKEIVEILRNEQRTVADHFEGASILFADVVDFTPLSATMTPDELVKLLNEIFSQFDLLVEKYGLEKIKTIGDCYMVAAGLPRPRDDHAAALTRMTLEMRDYLSQKEIQGHRLAMRFGINSGPVVAGVIGRKKFIYDLWGEAVNTASRMESQGQADAIQITGVTYELIKDEFICEPRGVLNVKGRGEIETWFVVGPRDGEKS